MSMWFKDQNRITVNHPWLLNCQLNNPTIKSFGSLAMLTFTNKDLTVQDHSTTKCPLLPRVILTLLEKWTEWLLQITVVKKIRDDWTQCWMFYSQETTPRHAIGHRGWSRQRTPGGAGGGRSMIRQPLRPGHLCSWHNAHASPCHRTQSTGGHTDTVRAEINICLMWNFKNVKKKMWFLKLCIILFLTQKLSWGTILLK